MEDTGLSDHPRLRDIVRPILVSLVALAVVACAMAAKGWHVGTIALGGILVLLSALLLIQVHKAVSHLHSRSSTIEQAACEAERHYISVLRRIVALSDARDRYFDGHSLRVGKMASQLSRRLGLDERTCELMELAGELHDLGMLAIPDRLWNQRAKMDGAAFSTIKQHCDIAFEMLAPLRSLAPVLPAIRHHHERMNGTGYPQGLAGEKVPLEARILAVADTYDALTHDRPHRTAISSSSAVEELRRCCPSGFDPLCVEALAEQVGAAPAALEQPVAAASNLVVCC